MPKFKITIEGRNFLVRMGGKPLKHGFMTIVLVESETAAEAETEAIALLRRDGDLVSATMNKADDPPTLRLDDVKEIWEWPDISRPRSGLIWYPEGGRTQRERKKRKQFRKKA
ncbi:MAG: hypothetical protein L0387_46300 [Acidobacteria bacterium]|nr:hypothetical protein [Acidobacteriota bacterium]